MNKMVLIILLVLIVGMGAYNIGKKDAVLKPTIDRSNTIETNTLNKENSTEGKTSKSITTSTTQKNSSTQTVAINKPFIMNVGDTVNITSSATIKFVKTQKVDYCGDDVMGCPDSVTLSYVNKTTGKTDTFSLAGEFQLYKLDNVDIMRIKRIDADTYEFKISPTQF